MGDRAEDSDRGNKKMEKENADEELAMQVESKSEASARETAWNITRKLSERRRTNVRKCRAILARARLLECVLVHVE